MVLKKLGRYYRTIKHLKWIQIRYQIWYRLRKLWRRLSGFTYSLSIAKKGQPLFFSAPVNRPVSLQGQTFSFLNRSYTFKGGIDWNYPGFGKLWAYNLNYFDYLQQPHLPVEKGLALIREFIHSMDQNREGLEPYPISLRMINWIKFISQHKITDAEIDAAIYAQYQILLDNLEYHLLGNHLLENGFSLYIGGCYFQDRDLYRKGREILQIELDEQILSDGGHFERSPMYHSILLERLLDCYNLSIHNDSFGTSDHSWLKNSCEKMLSWLRRMTFRNGDWPMVNDSAFGIADASRVICDYADRVGLKAASLPLSESCYRFLQQGSFEVLIDAGAIGPDYVPGHAHSDTLSFVMYVDGKPVVVDPGISTYEANAQRQLERSTIYHNTVMVDGVEQSEIWSAFRVGRRAHPEILQDKGGLLVATHSGYSHMGVRHFRTWRVENKEVVISDKVTGPHQKAIAFLHFHPDLDPVKKSSNIYKIADLELRINGADSIHLSSYFNSQGFNRRTEAAKLVIRFRNQLNKIFSN